MKNRRLSLILSLACALGAYSLGAEEPKLTWHLGQCRLQFEGDVPLGYPYGRIALDILGLEYQNSSDRLSTQVYLVETTGSNRISNGETTIHGDDICWLPLCFWFRPEPRPYLNWGPYLRAMLPITQAGLSYYGEIGIKARFSFLPFGGAYRSFGEVAVGINSDRRLFIGLDMELGTFIAIALACSNKKETE
jgi:hypothetical protein